MCVKSNMSEEIFSDTFLLDMSAGEAGCKAHDGCGVCVLISCMADVFDFYSSSYLDSLSLQVRTKPAVRFWLYFFKLV